MGKHIRMKKRKKFVFSFLYWLLVALLVAAIFVQAALLVSK